MRKTRLMLAAVLAIAAVAAALVTAGCGADVGAADEVQAKSAVVLCTFTAVETEAGIRWDMSATEPVYGDLGGTVDINMDKINYVASSSDIKYSPEFTITNNVTDGGNPVAAYFRLHPTYPNGTPGWVDPWYVVDTTGQTTGEVAAAATSTPAIVFEYVNDEDLSKNVLEFKLFVEIQTGADFS